MKADKLTTKILEEEMESRLEDMEEYIQEEIEQEMSLKDFKKEVEDGKNELFALAKHVDKINGNSHFEKKAIEATGMDAVEIAKKRIKENEEELKKSEENMDDSSIFSHVHSTHVHHPSKIKRILQIRKRLGK